MTVKKEDFDALVKQVDAISKVSKVCYDGLLSTKTKMKLMGERLIELENDFEEYKNDTTKKETTKPKKKSGKELE